MPRTLPVLINRSSAAAAAMGSGLAAAIENAFAETGRDVALRILDAEEIAAAARRHAGAPLVVVGGGDGTIGAAASALAHTSSALGVLPLGARNRFAHQLGLPLELAAAARLAVSGQRRRIDIGAAGDKVFVNHASFGIYARLLRQREEGPRSRWLGTVAATWHAVRSMRRQRFSLRIDGQRRELTTPLLMVGSDDCPGGFGSPGEGDPGDEGRLAFCLVPSHSPPQLLAFAARALFGLARPERDFRDLSAAQTMVIEGDGHIEGAFDGELALLPLPLRLRCLPGALGVVAPREVASVGAGLLASEYRTL